MKGYYYIGLDVHKKIIWYCIKKANGNIVDDGKLPATREALCNWAENLSRPWFGAMEATMFTGWVYDFLSPYAKELKVGHSYMIRAIAASKKKNDRVDAAKLADLLRCDLFPECRMASEESRELRRVLRYRNLLVREATRMKNKTAGLLMEVGAEYDKSRLHGRRYFNDLMERLDYVPRSVVHLLKLTHSSMEVFEENQKHLCQALKSHSALRERVERLMSIPGVGEITALTWALEIDDPHRFSSRKKAVSYCGLCSAQDESAGKSKRGPLSKQRNKHLQTVLVEAAKLAPRWNPQLAQVYQEEIRRGSNRNKATLAVARKLVAYLLYVDKTGKQFELRKELVTAQAV
jgi:transposase